MTALNRRQLVLLIALTIVWGFNWPVMKLGVTGFPPLTFRTLCMVIGLPILAMVMIRLRVPFKVERSQWTELFILSLLNMILWHILVILALKDLSGGRTAILGYTMPVFSAILGVAIYGIPMSWRGWLGVVAAGCGALLLLWHELTALSGKPWGVVMVLVAALAWAQGTHLMRRTKITVPTLTITFWMIVLTCICNAVLALIFETDAWHWPTIEQQLAIAYNAVLIFAFSQAVWLTLARHLTPLASSLSVMFIPVLGVFSSAYWLGERLHWQDWTAVGLIVLAMGSVLWPVKD